VIIRILWRAPNTGDAKRAASALRILIRAVQGAPGMSLSRTSLDSPTILLGMANRLLDAFVRMS
ncbi:hypothetical protein, partial [Ralstonia solanacearum]